MLGKTILWYSNDKATARRMSGHLRAAGNEVIVSEVATAAGALVAARAVDLVFVDAAAPTPLAVVAAARGAIPTVVLAAAAAEPAAMLELVCDHEVAHVLARSGDDGDGLDALAREVVITAEKILRADLFGIEKYLPAFGVEVTAAEIRGAVDRDEVVACIGDHVEWLGGGREARRAVEAVVDELVTNAIYDAPRDADGRARYHGTDRREKIVLDAWEHVTVRWGSDGDRLAISVTDWFGALYADQIRAGLRRCLTDGEQIEHKPGGAGLGLYTALAYSAQLVVNVDRGERTEVIAVIDLRRGGHTARRGGRSLHLFHDDSRARAARATADASPTTVMVSETLRVELRDRLVPARRRAVVVPLTKARRASSPRARGSSPPPAAIAGPTAPAAGEAATTDEPIGAGTACGLLHGAADPDAALRVALRFLTQHYQAAIAYAIDDNRLEPTVASGAVREWPLVKNLRLLTSGPSSLAARARLPEPTAFAPSCPLDYRLAMLVTGVSEAEGLVVPISLGDRVRWVLYAAGPRPDGVLSPVVLDQVRRDLTACLQRVDPDEPAIEVRLA